MEKGLVQVGLYLGSLSTAALTYNLLNKRNNKKDDNKIDNNKIDNNKIDNNIKLRIRNKNFCYKIYVK